MKELQAIFMREIFIDDFDSMSKLCTQNRLPWLLLTSLGIEKWSFKEMWHSNYLENVDGDSATLAVLAQQPMLKFTLIKFRIMIGLPYLLARFSKWSLVAWYASSFFDTAQRYG